MQLTNKYGLPDPIVRAVEADSHKMGDYSASGLSNPARLVTLRKRYDSEITEDASDRVWALFGKALHKVVEENEGAHQIAEGYLEVELYDGITLSGTSDLYDDDTQTVSDYKVTSAWTLVYGSRDEEWTKQLNTYAWLYREAGYKVEAMQIIAFLRDWSASKAERESSYPQINVIKIPIRMMPHHEIGAWIKSRVAWFEKHKDTPDDMLPYCTPEERWQSKSQWALMKDGRKRAVKLYDNEAEALNACPDDKHYVEERISEPKRCMKYCPVAAFCNQYQSELKQEGVA